jgi:hypothetical protein
VFDPACLGARDCIYVEETMKQFCLGIIVAAGLTPPAFGQGVDPLIGTWKLNLEKSTSTGPLPKSQTIAFTRDGPNIVNNGEGLDAQGQPYKFVFQHIYDGQPHPSSGIPNYDSSTFTRIGNTVNVVRFKNGKTVEVAQYILDPGKTYSGHAEGIAANGQPYHFNWVYDRQ